MNTIRKPFFILVGLILFYLAFEGFQRTGEPNDFTVYYRAAGTIRGDLSPYEIQLVPENIRLNYVYPPLLASALVPLTFFPAGVADQIWTALNLAALIGCLLLLQRLLYFHDSNLRVLAISTFAVLPFLRTTMRSGQVSIFLLFLILLALRQTKEKGTLLPCIPMGMAIGLKLYPAGAMLIWLFQERWKWIGVSLIFALSLSLLIPAMALGPTAGVHANLSFWNDLVPRSMGWKDAPDWFGYRSRHSYSIPSALYRWTSKLPAPIIPLKDSHRWVLTCLILGSWIALAWVGLKKLERVRPRPFPEERLLQLGLVVGLLPILGPISLKAGFIALLPVYAVLFAVPGRSPSRTRISWGLAGICLFLHLFPFRLVVGRQFTYELEAHSIILVGACCLYLAQWLRISDFTQKNRSLPLSPSCGQ